MSPGPEAIPSGPAAPRLMRVGELAERVGLSHRTVRHYDDEGLLTATARSRGNYRLYSEADVERMLVIRQMKPLGFSLDQMARVLTVLDAATSAGSAPPAAQEDLVDVGPFLEQATAARAELARQVVAADQLISHLELARALLDRRTL